MIHIREPYISSSAPLELPREVVWLRRGTIALLGLLLAILLFLALRAFMLAPWFSIARITVGGDTQFHNALTLRANVLPALTGHYFNVDLRTAQQRFEALPWIRSAVVQRTFPNTLAVTLTAHVPVARWGVETNDAGIERLVNAQGEIFEASGGHVDTDDLPQLAGPDAAAAEVLALYQSLQTSLQASTFNQIITELGQSQQGLWRAKLSSGAWLELGAGSKLEVMQRTQRWLGAMPAIIQKYNAHALQSLDLRYQDGFAMRLAGVTTRQGK
jgi:cell division protein FtsQ